MSIVEKLNAIKDTVPHYWPIGAFIHHNPLKGFESMKFKEGLEKARLDETEISKKTWQWR